MNLVTRNIARLEAGTATSRFLRALAHAQCSGTVIPAEFARGWPDTPEVQKAFEGFFTKAAVPGATTTDAAWAGALSGTGIGAEALTIVRDRSIVGAAERRMRRLPFLVASPRQTGTGEGGGWVPEGASAATVAYAFDTLTPRPSRVQSIAVIVDELARDKLADRTVREVVLGGHARLTDALFLDPTQAPDAGRPGSITNGATEVTSTGTTAAQMTADFAAMLGAIETSGTGLTWIMRPRTLARSALVLPGTVEGGRFLGIPVIASGNSPQQITLVDLAEIAYADSGEIDLSVSKNAVVQMTDVPTNNSAAPVATSVISLFQTDSLAYRTTRWLWWARVGDNSVAYMTVTY